MGKVVKLKNPQFVVRIYGREPVHAGNLTTELYESLVKENPNYEALFVVVDEKEEKKSPKE
jgi:hypothetical protein